MHHQADHSEGESPFGRRIQCRNPATVAARWPPAREAKVTFDDAKTDVEALTKATADTGYPSDLKR